MNPPSLKARQSKQIWVGIDPGMSGAISAINEKGEFLWVEDMPVIGEGRKGEYDVLKIVRIVREVGKHPHPRVLLEWPTTRPDESAESSKRFGVGLGLLVGACAASGVLPERVAPNKWKGRLGLQGKEQDPLAARQQAVRAAEDFIIGLPPTALYGVKGGLKDGRAESLLIAWEGLTRTREGLLNQPEDVRLLRALMGGSKARRKVSGDPF